VAILASKPVSVTGYEDDAIYRDFIMSSVTATGSGVGPISRDPWALHLNPVFTVPDSPSGYTLSRITVRANTDASLSPWLRYELTDVLNVLLQSVVTSVSPVGYVDTLCRLSDLSLKTTKGHLEIEAKIASIPERISPNLISHTRKSDQSSGLLSHADPVSEKDRDTGRTKQETSHPRLARELREMTGLSASSLGHAFGVSREQYSRWISGKPISDIRHGQLVFLHTVAREMVRRLGADQARVWIHKPIEGVHTPATLLELRTFDKFYREVVAIPDPEPVRDGSIISLSAPVAVDDENEDEGDEPWSPYDCR
jgi:DNA-binding transcriptional regulator YiaG